MRVLLYCLNLRCLFVDIYFSPQICLSHVDFARKGFLYGNDTCVA
jgi:hypothetical protein